MVQSFCKNENSIILEQKEVSSEEKSFEIQDDLSEKIFESFNLQDNSNEFKSFKND